MLNRLVLNPGYKNFPAMAYSWQSQTHGVVQTGSFTRPYKYFAVDQRKDQIQTVVLGSSQSFGIRSQNSAFYNLSSEANPTACMVKEALDLARRLPNLKKLVFSVDLFREFRVGDPATVCANEVLKPAASGFSLLTWDLSKISFIWAAYKIQNRASLAEFWSATEYPCPNEKALGLDLFFISPGQCFGFRDDGSSTFAYLPRNPSLDLHNFIPLQDRYTFNPSILTEMTKALQDFRRRGGQVVFLFPPVFPGLEASLSRLPNVGPSYVPAKNKFIEALEAIPGVTVVDAIASEKFNCTPEMFLDSTHALSQCFALIKNLKDY